MRGPVEKEWPEAAHAVSDFDVLSKGSQLSTISLMSAARRQKFVTKKPGFHGNGRDTKGSEPFGDRRRFGNLTGSSPETRTRKSGCPSSMRRPPRPRHSDHTGAKARTSGKLRRPGKWTRQEPGTVPLQGQGTACPQQSGRGMRSPEGSHTLCQLTRGQQSRPDSHITAVAEAETRLRRDEALST